MRLIVFGLRLSSWGNGHATLWRAWVDLSPAEDTRLRSLSGAYLTLPIIGISKPGLMEEIAPKRFSVQGMTGDYLDLYHKLAETMA
jgi:hypothetical protein